MKPQLKSLLLVSVLLAAGTNGFAAAPADEPATPPIKPMHIMPYLDRVIGWRKAIVNSDVVPDNGREVVIRDKLKANSKQTMDESFAFARAETVILQADKNEEAKPEDAETRRGRILKSAADVNARIADLQSQLKAPGLGAGDREKLNGQLKLAKAQQELLQTMTTIFVNQEEKSGKLIDQINLLAHTADEDTGEQPAAGKANASADSDAPKEKTADHGDDKGIFSLCASMFTFAHKSSAIADISQQTDVLIQTNHDMIASVRGLLKDALAEGNALTISDVNDAKSIADYNTKLDALIVRYKQLSATVVPLGEMIALLETDQRHLKEWSNLIHADWKHVFHQLLFRLIVLAVGIAVPIILSKVAYRSINRYVQDPKRQKQLRILTQVLLYASLTFVVLANFISEFGSLATFAGFITAGLAVALQTVLVSLCAHFFFYGRYGVRVGDRITIGDVTGDIVQIGMLRIYLKQYADTENGLQPTGKLVAFPNSILFQPAGFYKHMSDQEIKNVRAY